MLVQHQIYATRLARRTLETPQCALRGALKKRLVPRASLAGLSVNVGLKEWAVTCAALGAGDQTILLRKGGLQDRHFTVPHRRFWLLPTAFHSVETLVKPDAAEEYIEELAFDPRQHQRIPLRTMAEVTGLWATQEPDILRKLDLHHIWGPGFLTARLKWRPATPLTLLELRCYRLDPRGHPPGGPSGDCTLRNSDALWGCFSWASWAGGDLTVPQGAALRPVRGDADWKEDQWLLRDALSGTDARELPLPG